MDDTKLAEIRHLLDALADWGYGGRKNDPDLCEKNEQQMIDYGYELYDAVVAMSNRIRDMERVRGGGQR